MARRRDYPSGAIPRPVQTSATTSEATTSRSSAKFRDDEGAYEKFTSTQTVSIVSNPDSPSPRKARFTKSKSRTQPQEDDAYDIEEDREKGLQVS